MLPEFIKSRRIAGVGQHPQLYKDTLSPWGIAMCSSVRGQVTAQQREHSQGMSKEWRLGFLRVNDEKERSSTNEGHTWVVPLSGSGQRDAGMWCGQVISTSNYFYVGGAKVSRKQRLDTFRFSHVNIRQFLCWGQMSSPMTWAVQVKVNCVAFLRKDSLVFR